MNNTLSAEERIADFIDQLKSPRVFGEVFDRIDYFPIKDQAIIDLSNCNQSILDLYDRKIIKAYLRSSGSYDPETIDPERLSMEFVGIFENPYKFILWYLSESGNDPDKYFADADYEELDSLWFQLSACHHIVCVKRDCYVIFETY